MLAKTKTTPQERRRNKRLEIHETFRFDQFDTGTTAANSAVPRCGEFMSREAALRAFEIRRLMRQRFYADLNRGVPTSIAQMPSYVRAVQKHWGMQYRNSARRLLAQIEGFSSWEEMMAAE